MYLCVDVGNSQIHCGVFTTRGELQVQFRYNTSQFGSSDQFAVFLLQVLRENDIDPPSISRVAIASVVPSIDYSIASAFVKYFNVTPLFLQPGIKTGIKISSNNPAEIGADLIAGALGGITAYAGKHLLIFDFGTATTLIYINPQAEFIGGAVLPGLRLMMESLQHNTAKLFTVNISAPKQAISKDTRAAIQSGLYYTQIGAARELVNRVINENNIPRDEMVVIATGGFAGLLNSDNVFDVIIPELVLTGLFQIILLNS